jgi:hypothetical protein
VRKNKDVNLRRILPWLTVILLIAVIYDGAIFYSRWSANQAVSQKQEAKETEHARNVVKMLGGDELGILSFYAAPGSIRAGGPTTICYGVNGAKTVHLDPPTEEVWPALSHCLQASPRKTTEYKLTAEDGAGHSVSQAITVKIKP